MTMQKDQNRKGELGLPNDKLSFKITIRDIAHFYKIILWLNRDVGEGKKNWTMGSRVLKYLRNNETVTTNIYIFNTSCEFDDDSITYLTLI